MVNKEFKKRSRKRSRERSKQVRKVKVLRCLLPKDLQAARRAAVKPPIASMEPAPNEVRKMSPAIYTAQGVGVYKSLRTSTKSVKVKQNYLQRS